LKIAVLSGKGGTGKTFCAVNLAANSSNSVYIDCDIEEPNGHLFFKPSKIHKENVHVLIPSINETLCDGCRKCVDFCQFNALAFVSNRVIVFKDICHSCGGCALVCPNQAIFDISKKIGVIEDGIALNTRVISGFLDLGIESGIPIIKKIIQKISQNESLVLIDCPPGSSCSVIESIQNADFCLIVAEPTIFGAHNLEMVYELVKMVEKPFGVLLNKSMGIEDPSENFCQEHEIPIMGKIPYDEELGQLNAEALIAVFENNNYKKIFEKILSNIISEVHHETTINS